MVKKVEVVGALAILANAQAAQVASALLDYKAGDSKVTDLLLAADWRENAPEPEPAAEPEMPEFMAGDRVRVKSGDWGNTDGTITEIVNGEAVIQLYADNVTTEKLENIERV